MTIPPPNPSISGIGTDVERIPSVLRSPPTRSRQRATPGTRREAAVLAQRSPWLRSDFHTTSPRKRNAATIYQDERRSFDYFAPSVRL